MAPKLRVHELAKELGLTNKECLDLCLDLGIGVKTHSSSIIDAQADRVRRKAEREGLVRDQQPEEPAKPAKKAPAKKAAAKTAEPEAPAVQIPEPAPAAEAAPAPAAEPESVPEERTPEPAISPDCFLTSVRIPMTRLRTVVP